MHSHCHIFFADVYLFNLTLLLDAFVKGLCHVWDLIFTVDFVCLVWSVSGAYSDSRVGILFYAVLMLIHLHLSDTYSDSRVGILLFCAF